MFYRTFLMLITVTFFLIPAQAHAGKNVTSPYVSKGDKEIEAKTQIDMDDDASQEGIEQSLEVGYGLSDHVGLEAGIKFEDRAGKDLAAKAMEVETKIQFTEQGSYFLDTGIKLKYAHNLQGDADSVSAKLLFGKRLENWQHYANLQIGWDIGEDSSDNEEYSAAWKTQYNLGDHFNPGFEYYADFGDLTENYDGQSHRMGPAAYGDIAARFGYDAGLLAGISEGAPVVTLKINLEYGF